MNKPNELAIDSKFGIRRLDDEEWWKRGLSILADSVPTDLKADKILIQDAVIYAVEFPASTRFREDNPEDGNHSNDFHVHSFSIDGAYISTTRFSLLNLKGLRDRNGKRACNSIWVLGNKIHVYEPLYHGRCFVEHVFLLDGTLVGIFTDDVHLSGDQRIPSSQTFPTFTDTGRFWTAAIRPGGRFGLFFYADTTAVERRRIESSGIPRFFLDRLELLRRTQTSRQLELYQDPRCTPLSHILAAQLPLDAWPVSGDDGVWTISYDPESTPIASFYKQHEGMLSRAASLNLNDLPVDLKGRAWLQSASSSDALISPYVICFIQDRYCYLRSSRHDVIQRLDFDLLPIVRSHFGSEELFGETVGSRWYSRGIDPPALSDGIISVRLENVKDDSTSVLTYDVTTGASTAFVPMVPMSRLLKSSSNLLV